VLVANNAIIKPDRGKRNFICEQKTEISPIEILADINVSGLHHTFGAANNVNDTFGYF